MHLIIREATAADMPAVAAIYAHYVLHTCISFELTPPPPAEMAQRWQTARDADYPWLVAERDGNVIGYAYAGPFRTRPAYRLCVENSIYLHPDAQRQGAGKRLLAALIARCQQQGFRQMVAAVAGNDNAASVALHRHFGFALAGELKDIGYKFGQFISLSLLQRAL